MVEADGAGLHFPRELQSVARLAYEPRMLAFRSVNPSLNGLPAGIEYLGISRTWHPWQLLFSKCCSGPTNPVMGVSNKTIKTQGGPKA